MSEYTLDEIYEKFKADHAVNRINALRSDLRFAIKVVFVKYGIYNSTFTDTEAENTCAKLIAAVELLFNENKQSLAAHYRREVEGSVICTLKKNINAYCGVKPDALTQ